MKLKVLAALIALLELGASCSSTPSAPPDAKMPSVYRGDASTSASLGDMPWRKLYDDPVLQGLIERALAKNFDVEVAYTQILESEAQLGITAADQSVFVNGVAQAPYQAINAARGRSTSRRVAFFPQVGISASYQLDLFGKLASATGSARNQLALDRKLRPTRSWPRSFASCDRLLSTTRARRCARVHASKRSWRAKKTCG